MGQMHTGPDEIESFWHVRHDFYDYFPCSIEVSVWYNLSTSTSHPLAVAFCLEAPTTAGLNACMVLQRKLQKRQKEGMDTSNCQAVNVFLETYFTDDGCAETDNDMMCFTQLLHKSPTEYAGALWNQVLWCYRVYEEYLLKGIFILGLLESIQNSIRSY